MSGIKSHTRSIFFVVPALVILIILGLSAFNKAFSGLSDESLTVLTEADFSQDHALFAVADENIVAVFLESPSAEVENSDTGGIGYDVIPYRYRESMKQTFCWQDADEGAGHYMTLTDSGGNEALTVTANGACETALIKPGEYEMRLYHDGQTDKGVAVFVVSEENKSTLSTTTEEALSNLATFLDTNRCAGCDLSGVNLFKADLSGVDLSDAILNDAILTEANLSEADLSGAELKNADLSRADLTGADLSGADLSGAILINADLTDANLLQANLENADTAGAIFTNTNLTGVKQTKSADVDTTEDLTVLKVDDTCASGTLDPGDGTKDLFISGTCNVGSGVYQYQNVNIIQNGVLHFQDDGGATHFWAKSILVEKGGSILAGYDPMTQMIEPFGTNGGTLTIHLYGLDSDKAGIECRSPLQVSSVPCGIKPAVWNSTDKVCLPPQADNMPPNCQPYDYFYKYTIGEDNKLVNETGFFGRKVLAVSYGGTIKFYGQKGATYGQVLENSDSGKSWARLDGTIHKDATQLKVDRTVDWGVGDRIVVTTTDYLPGHSELLEITEVVSSKEFKFKAINPFTGADLGGLQFTHNGSTYPLSDAPKRLMLNINEAETRAAVALLSRSIRIVSGPDMIPADSAGKMCKYDCFPNGAGFYGGHTMIRQGAQEVKIQGVEFYRLGQGGRKGRYPVHMHLLRKTPQTNTNPPESVFVIEDNSVYESMTRWYTIHGTQGVTLKRNVGYLSIGHGYYLEDGTETDNKLYSNIGIFARAAIDNKQNPRKVPGILAWTGDKVVTNAVPTHSDYAQPTVFWIMNGWNDFEYNMAAGAGTCGGCYWWVPGYISGPSRMMKWEGYASQQSNSGRAGDTPLKNFTGNHCTSAMNAFNSIHDTSICNGLGSPLNPDFPTLEPIETGNISPDPVTNQGMAYYPGVIGVHHPTLCPDPSKCSTVPTCSAGDRTNCAVPVIDRFTTAFNWPETNFAAIWLRPQWYLVINSVISDVQNAGLSFVTGGDYTEANFIPGQWQLARQNAFIGQTQPDDSNYALAQGPVNKKTTLECEKQSNVNKDVVGNYCLLRDEGVIFQLSNYANNQRLFNIYDGPSFEDSNAFFHIRTTPIDGCTVGQGNCSANKSMYGRVPLMPYDKEADLCYLPHAAIAWKQPNGFYYPPAFHSSNLYFRNDVDIRHFVIEPLFEPDSQYAFKQWDKKTKENYCTFTLNDAMGANGSFGNFSAIDRQTILNDDDGSLTGLKGTISVNEDPFFNAPTETIECESAGTAKTSPYDYVTTVVYPGCVAKKDCGGHCAKDNKPCADTANCDTNNDPQNICDDTNAFWQSDCGSSFCYGVPLYRQFLNKDEASNTKGQEIRMMGMNFFQRSNLTANHGRYYIDTTVNKENQLKGLLPTGQKPSVNVFKGGEEYYVLLIFAKDTTVQTYQIYVGMGRDPNKIGDIVHAIKSPLKSSRPLDVLPINNWPAKWGRSYSSGTGILTVKIDMSDYKTQYNNARMDRCKPESFCEWSGNAANGTCKCSEELMNNDPELYAQCMKPLGDDMNTICDWAVRAVDCPEGGCLGFAFTLVDEPPAEPLDPPAPCCFPDNTDWNVDFNPVSETIAGTCHDTSPPGPEFCTNPKCMMNVDFPPQGPQPTDEPEPPQAPPPPGDQDNDGVPDGVDADSDNDGIPNDTEMSTNGTSSLTSTRLQIPADPDGDGIPNELDLDSDGDGLTDHSEAGGTDDADGDGRADNFTDADMDGLNDAYEPSQGGTALPLPDSDGDGIPDFLDSVNNVGDAGEGGSDNSCAIAGTGTGKSGLAGLLIYALIPAVVLIRRRLMRIIS